MSDTETQERRAERGRAIVARLRDLEAEDRARYEAFAATIMSKNRKHVHRRDPAAAMVSAAINAPIRASCCGEATVVSSSRAGSLITPRTIFASWPRASSTTPSRVAVRPTSAAASSSSPQQPLERKKARQLASAQGSVEPAKV